MKPEELARPRFGFFMGVEPHRIDVLGFNELLAAKRASVVQREPGSFKAMQDAADLQWLLAHRPARSRRRR